MTLALYTDASALGLHPRTRSLQGTSSPKVPAPFRSQPLFLLVSLCEVVNAILALHGSARSSFLWTNCPIMVSFFPMKTVVPVRSYLPKVAVTISSHDIAKSPCLLVRLKHVYLKLRSEVVSNKQESALSDETGFFSALIIIK